MSATVRNACVHGTVAALFLVSALTGCLGRPSPALPPDPPTAVSASGTPQPTGTPVPQLPYPISGLPLCKGLVELQTLVPIDWPNIDEAYKKLATYNWGYYSCDLPVPELIRFIQDRMPRPPYLWTDINGAEHKTGMVRAYFQSIQVIWVYTWMLPGPDGQSSYLVIAKSNPGEIETWECRLPPKDYWPFDCRLPSPVLGGHTVAVARPAAPGNPGRERST